MQYIIPSWKSSNLLWSMVLLPLVASIVLGFFSRNSNAGQDKAEKGSFGIKLNNKGFLVFGLAVAITVFALALIALLNFDSNLDGYQMASRTLWFDLYWLFGKGARIYFAVGIDGVSLGLILLSSFLLPICFIACLNSSNVVQFRVKELVICFLLLQSAVIGSLISLDLLLFYLFFEVMLIPMFFIIGIWGGKDRIFATYKFFLYTAFGSLLFLLSIIYLLLQNGDVLISNLTLSEGITNLKTGIYGFIEEPLVRKFLWFGMFIAFAIKTPMIPFHTWLPDAHVQAPTVGSMVLAGILIKIGTYAMFRFLIPIFPQESLEFAKYIFILSAIAVVYGSLLALAQSDIKKMIAYSSIAHMGFVTAGLFSANEIGVSGAVYQMLSHGIISAGLFFATGTLYVRSHTLLFADYGGVAKKMPLLATAFMILTFGSIAVPSTMGFVGEFLVLLGLRDHKFFLAIMVLGVILGASYMLLGYRKIFFGKQSKLIDTFVPLAGNEVIVLLVLSSLVIIFGLMPFLLTDIYDVAVKGFIQLTVANF